MPSKKKPDALKQYLNETKNKNLKVNALSVECS